MKNISYSLIIILSLLLVFGCTGKGGTKKTAQAPADTSSVPDTGYTGIKQYMSGSIMVRQTTFKNGVKEGISRSFYPSGILKQTYWYENGLREDSALWYYDTGQVYRSTNYKHDTIDGIQRQYYKIGKVKAQLGYRKGFRTTYFQEFTQDGKVISGYPDLVVNVKDEYKTKGIYGISLTLTDNFTKVKYYRGEFREGLFVTTYCKLINVIKGAGVLELKKTGAPTTNYVGVIAAILTNFGNNRLVYKKIDLPYNDLK